MKCSKKSSILVTVALALTLIPSVLADTGVSGNWTLSGYEQLHIYQSGHEIPYARVYWALNCWNPNLAAESVVSVNIDWGLGAGLRPQHSLLNGQTIQDSWQYEGDYPSVAPVNTVYHGTVQCIQGTSIGTFSFTVSVVDPASPGGGLGGRRPIPI